MVGLLPIISTFPFQEGVFSCSTCCSTPPHVVQHLHMLFNSSTCCSTPPQVVQLLHMLFNSSTSCSTPPHVVQLLHKLFNSSTSCSTPPHLFNSSICCSTPPQYLRQLRIWTLLNQPFSGYFKNHSTIKFIKRKPTKSAFNNLLITFNPYSHPLRSYLGRPAVRASKHTCTIFQVLDVGGPLRRCVICGWTDGNDEEWTVKSSMFIESASWSMKTELKSW